MFSVVDKNYIVYFFLFALIGLSSANKAGALSSNKSVSTDGNYTLTANPSYVSHYHQNVRLQETFTGPSGGWTKTYSWPTAAGTYIFTAKPAGEYTYWYKYDLKPPALNSDQLNQLDPVPAKVTVIGPSEVGERILLDRYDVYYGDFNNDGRDGDIYFHGKELFVLIADTISIPIFLTAPPSFVFYQTTSVGTAAYTSGALLQIPKDQLALYVKAVDGYDFYTGDTNGDNAKDVLVRGRSSNFPALLVRSTSDARLPDSSGFTAWLQESGEHRFHISDRTHSIALEDRNGDGLDDVVRVGGRMYADWVYTSAATGIPQPVPIFDALPKYTPANLVGSSDGKFRVNEQGAATYLMPISVPAGTAGVAPDVSLTYSSQAGNGLVGYGWSLNAYSSIRRCPKTLSHDGKSQPLRLDDQDALCLDGSRLLTSGSSMRTELDSSIRVKKQGAFYIAEAKDGSIKFYGEDVAQRQITADGRILQWALSKACDSVGNCIDFKYEQVTSGSTKGSDFRLAQIAYAYGGQSQPNSQLDFVYETEDRGDVGDIYVAGNLIKSAKRLKEIQVKSRLNNSSGFNELRRYTLHYKRTSPTDAFARSYLDGIQECVSGDCLPETRFSWVHNHGNSFADKTWSSSVLLEKGHSFMGELAPLDINGDGFMDIAWVENDHEHAEHYYNGEIRYALYDPASKGYIKSNYSDGDDDLYVSGNDGGNTAADHGHIKLRGIDYNADGRADLAIYITKLKLWQIHLAVPGADGKSWQLAKNNISISDIDVSTAMLDLDSDGLQDILTFNDARYLKKKPNVQDLVSPNEYQAAVNVQWSYTPRPFVNTDGTFKTKRIVPLGDLNGDGAADVLLVERQYTMNLSSSGRLYCKVTEENYYAMVNTEGGRVFNEFAFLGRYSVSSDKGYCNSPGPYVAFFSPNLNNDAYTDLLIRRGKDLLAYLNDGTKFLGFALEGNNIASGGQIALSFTGSSDDEAKWAARNSYIDFVDMNGDGYVDVLYREFYRDGSGNERYRPYTYRKWNPSTNLFESTVYSAQLVNTVTDTSERHFFIDATGDGKVDYLRVYNEYMMELRPNQTAGLTDLIVDIKNGLGARTSIEYQSLTSTPNYQSIEDRLAFEKVDFNAAGQPYSYLSSSAIANPLANYYPVIRNPFSGPLAKEQTFIDNFTAPVFEYMAPANLVTKVSGDSPSWSTTFGQTNSFSAGTRAEVHYYYGGARVQAGGRGFLGFRSVATKDPQTGVIVETRYRQDWPFVGLPETTITYAPTTLNPNQNLASIYAQSIKHDQHKLQNWVSTWPSSANFAGGTAALGPMKVYLDRSEEVAFQFSTNATTTTAITPSLVSGGNWCATYSDSAGCKLFPKTTTQAVLQRSVTKQIYDAQNNPTEIIVVTQGPGLKQTQKTVNDFGNTETLTLPVNNGVTRAAATYKELGRLKSATVTTIQERTGQTSVTDIKTSKFSYFTSGKFAGLLNVETAYSGLGDEFQQASIYGYDAFGNKNSITTEAKAISYNRAGTRTVGAVQQRKARTEYDLTGRYLAKTFKDFGAPVGEKLLEEVVDRAPNGAPTRTRSDVTVTETIMEYDVLGRTAGGYTTGASDNWTAVDYLPCSGNLACPSGTAFVIETANGDGSLSRVYTDILGRTIRETAKNFEGTMTHVDTQYDKLGRVIRVSQPYKVNTSALYWTENQYDVLGRLVKTKAPDGGMNTFAYNGYATVATNALNIKKTETKNGFGELAEVKDHLGGRLEYVYNTRSQLTKVIKHPAPSDIYLGTATVVTELEYDVTGRKLKMIDADKGTWQYRYNAFGELLWQKDANDQVQLQKYDTVGRLLTRTDYKSDGAVENHTRWYYDGYTDSSSLFIPNATGQVSAVVMTGSAASDTLACTLDNSARQCSYYQFDAYGRPTENATQLFADNKSQGIYGSKVEYDSFGRVNKEYDALHNTVKNTAGAAINSGVQNHYSPTNGELEKITDIASGKDVYQILEKSIRGQAGRILYGNGLTTHFSYFDATGLLNTQKTTNSLNQLIQDQAYSWDLGANLKWRFNKGLNVNNTARNVQESFCYDGLNRLTRAYRGTTSGGCAANPSGGTDVSITSYDSFGNIREKYTRHNYTGTETRTGFSEYKYGASNSGGYAAYAGPHAATRTVNIANNAMVRYAYDQNGNMTKDEDGRTIDYSTYDMPIRIAKGSHATLFAYGIDRSRYWRKDTSGGKTTETLYLGNVERITQGTNVIWKRYVGGVALYETKTDTSNKTLTGTATFKSYMHKDHLGSLDVITNDTGASAPVAETAGFDSWGERRNSATAKEYTAAQLIAFADAGRSLTSVPNYSVHALYQARRTTKGFTGHEMLDEMGIVHMNGRIYDPTLGRFLQADPIIQASTNTQSYNRYTYVFNNPLNATDPSGFTSSAFHEVKKAAGIIIAAAYTAACWGSCSAVAYGFIAALGAAANGADGKGILIAAVTAYAGAAIMGSNNLQFWDKVALSGVVGGIAATLTGGNFGNSFIAAGIGAYFGSADLGAFSSNELLRVGVAAVVGGTSSKLTGGKFKNGAGTAAFMAIVSLAASGKRAPSPGDSRVCETTCGTKLSKAEREAAIAKTADLSKDLIGKVNGSAREAAEILHHSAVKRYFDKLGVEGLAVIDQNTFAIKSIKINKWFSSTQAEGIYDPSYSGYQRGDYVWHTHPSRGEIHFGDYNSAVLGRAAGIFASGRDLSYVSTSWSVLSINKPFIVPGDPAETLYNYKKYEGPATIQYEVYGAGGTVNKTNTEGKWAY